LFLSGSFELFWWTKAEKKNIREHTNRFNFNEKKIVAGNRESYCEVKI